jgi:hypothetical protein
VDDHLPRCSVFSVLADAQKGLDVLCHGRCSQSVAEVPSGAEWLLGRNRLEGGEQGIERMRSGPRAT